MSERAAGSTAELTFLALAGPGYEVGIAAERVREVVAAAAWSGAPSLELAELIPALAAGDAAPRILAIALGDGELLPLRTRAAIAVRTVDAAALWRLPRVVTRRARWIRGVVLTDAAVPLVVIDPDTIGGRADEATPPHRTLEELW